MDSFFLPRLRRACSAVVSTAAMLVIIGWFLRWRGLEGLFIDVHPVHFLLAVAFACAGYCLWSERRPPAMAAAALAIGAYTLAEYALGRGLPVDDFLPPDPTLINPALPGHMTFMSALGLSLCGLALLPWRGSRPTNLLAGLAWAFSLLALADHFYGIRILTGWMDMALPSAAIFLLLSTAILAARPGLVTRLLVSPATGGIVARKFLPPAILVPIVLGWLGLRLFGSRLSDPRIYAALVIAIAAVFAIMVVILSRRIEETALALERSRIHFDAAVASVKDYAIFLLDAQGRVRTWNAGAQAIKGYEASEIIGRHFSAFYPAEEISSGKPAKELAIAAGEGRYHEEGWRLRKDGSRFWASSVLTAVRDEAGGLSGYLKVTRDMTDTRQKEEDLRLAMAALKRSNQELEQFAYVASHDLQEPLRKVISFAQLFAQRYADKADSTGARYIRYVVESAERMRQLIVDLLAYSRLGGVPATSLVELGAVARAAWSDLGIAVKESKARIEIEDLPRVKGDPQRLLQLFSNLLGNAIKFRKASEPPLVRVRADPQEGGFVISIADNGIGIEPRFHQQIFAMFRRLHARGEYAGTGIGLAICKRIVEQMGGSLWVESELGRGSTFRFTLPKDEI